MRCPAGVRGRAFLRGKLGKATRIPGNPPKCLGQSGASGRRIPRPVGVSWTRKGLAPTQTARRFWMRFGVEMSKIPGFIRAVTQSPSQMKSHKTYSLRTARTKPRNFVGRCVRHLERLPGVPGQCNFSCSGVRMPCISQTKCSGGERSMMSTLSRECDRVRPGRYRFRPVNVHVNRPCCIGQSS